MAEAHAAGEEAGDAEEALGPAVRLRQRLVGGAKAEKNRVTGLHADERRPRVVRDRVDEAGDEAADKQEDGAMSRRDWLREIRARSLG